MSEAANTQLGKRPFFNDQPDNHQNKKHRSNFNVKTTLIVGRKNCGKSTLTKNIVDEGTYTSGYYLSDDIANSPKNAVLFDSKNRQLVSDYLAMVTSIITEYRRFIVVDDTFDVNFGDLIQRCKNAKIDLFVISVYDKPGFNDVYSFCVINKRAYTAAISKNGVIVGWRTTNHRPVTSYKVRFEPQYQQSDDELVGDADYVVDADYYNAFRNPAEIQPSVVNNTECAVDADYYKAFCNPNFNVSPHQNNNGERRRALAQITADSLFSSVYKCP